MAAGAAAADAGAGAIGPESMTGAGAGAAGATASAGALYCGGSSRKVYSRTKRPLARCSAIRASRPSSPGCKETISALGGWPRAD
ncbi:MAG: hypothetical protein FJY47_02955 [Betaproteobacteria bacterium]|nr:hypothetical protein [Betaproteobacteria bacterium]MBM3384625.1 hypothetical protein [Betaproteobacteria bacterium]